MKKLLQSYTVTELAAKCAFSRVALYKRLERADKSGGQMLIDGLGYFIVRRHGKNYQALKLPTGTKAASQSEDIEIAKAVLNVLEQQAPHLCDKCRKNIAEPMMRTAKENM